jgi:hypothetical protein
MKSIKKNLIIKKIQKEKQKEKNKESKTLWITIVMHNVMRIGEWWFSHTL